MIIPYAAIWGIVHATAKSGYLSPCNWGMSYKPSAMWVSNQISSNPRPAILKRVKISLQLQFLRLKKQKFCRSKGVWSRINHSDNSNGCYSMFLTEARIFFKQSLLWILVSFVFGGYRQLRIEVLETWNHSLGILLFLPFHGHFQIFWGPKGNRFLLKCVSSPPNLRVSCLQQRSTALAMFLSN